MQHGTDSVDEARLGSSCFSRPSRATPRRPLFISMEGFSVITFWRAEPGPIGQPSLFTEVINSSNLAQCGEDGSDGKRY